MIPIAKMSVDTSNIRETATPTARNKNLIINLKHLESNYLPKKKNQNDIKEAFF